MSLFSKTREDLHAVVAEHAQLLEQVKEMNNVALASSNISDDIKKKRQDRTIQSNQAVVLDAKGDVVFSGNKNTPGQVDFPNFAYIGAFAAGGGGRPSQNRREPISTGGGTPTRGGFKKANEYGLAGTMLEQLGFPLEPLYVLAWNRIYVANGQGFNFPTVDQIVSEYEFLSYHPEITVNILGNRYPNVSKGAPSTGSGNISKPPNTFNSAPYGNAGYSSSTNQSPPTVSSGGKAVVDAVSKSGNQIVVALGRIERRLEASTSSDFRRIIGQ